MRAPVAFGVWMASVVFGWDTRWERQVGGPACGAITVANGEGFQATGGTKYHAVRIP